MRGGEAKGGEVRVGRRGRRGAQQRFEVGSRLHLQVISPERTVLCAVLGVFAKRCSSSGCEGWYSITARGGGRGGSGSWRQYTGTPRLCIFRRENANI